MNKTYNENDLDKYNKNTIISMYISLQKTTDSLKETSELQREQMASLEKKIDLLLEQIAIANQRQFGRSSEKIELDGQMELCFNEAEVLIDTHEVIDEPDLLDVCIKPRKKKSKGQREANLKDLPIKVIQHEMTNTELKDIFGEKWRRLPDEVYNAPLHYYILKNCFSPSF